MTIKIPLEKLSQKKISISFTWDDNSIRHNSIIAPLFIENGFRCTFYIVPGDQEFDSLYVSEYIELLKKGFEIGSHSYSHKYMTSLSKKAREFELHEAVQKILKSFNHYPITFAFPNHDYNDLLIHEAQNYHLETRNTLNNALRFSIKTDTPIKKLTKAVDEAILNNNNLVFSGHSIITEEEYLNKEKGEGYQPIRIPVLSKLLLYLRNVTSKADVTTFSQSALREFIKKIAIVKNHAWEIDPDQLLSLEKFHITKNNIISEL